MGFIITCYLSAHLGSDVAQQLVEEYFTLYNEVTSSVQSRHT